MGKLGNLILKGMSDSEKKELQQALSQLSQLNAKLTAKYTLVNDLELITDGRTAAARLIKPEIEQLRNSINEVDRNPNGTPKRGYYWHWHSSTRQPKGHHAFYC